MTRRIIVVGAARAAAEALRRAGAGQVEVVADPADLAARLGPAPPALIVLDLDALGGSVGRLLGEVRAAPATRGVPVIGVTSRPDAVGETPPLGLDGLVTLRRDPEALVAVARRWLEPGASPA